MVKPLIDKAIYFSPQIDQFAAHTFAHTTSTTVLHLAKEGIPSFKRTLAPASLLEICLFRKQFDNSNMDQAQFVAHLHRHSKVDPFGHRPYLPWERKRNGRPGAAKLSVNASADLFCKRIYQHAPENRD